jgi:hypothetical protein
MWMRWTFRPGHHDDVAVTVEVEGITAASSMERLAEEVADQTSAGKVVIIDVDGLVLTSEPAVRELVARLNERCLPGEVVLACRRSTGRRLLRRWTGGSIPVVAGHAEPAAT